MSKPIYCSLAFNAASLTSNKTFRPCCNVVNWDSNNDQQEFSIENINSLQFQQLRSELIDGKWPDVCINCKRNEDSDAPSMRTIWNAALLEFTDESNLTPIIDPASVYYLDLTIGRQCNSKCMTCGPQSSTLWDSEWKYIFIDNTLSTMSSDPSDDEIILLLSTFSNIRYASLIGGEPTICSQHMTFLRQLIKDDRCRDIQLSYVTNLTNIDSELLDYWSKFKTVALQLSIDGIKEINEYIRYPFKWNKVENNLYRIAAMPSESVIFGLSTTVSVFNCIHIPDLILYWYNFIVEHNMEDSPYVNIFFNRVNHPDFMMIEILPIEYKTKNFYKLDELEILIKSKDTKLAKLTLETIELYKNMMTESYKYDKDKYTALINFINRSDKFRNRDIKNYIPELIDILEKTYNEN